MKKLFRVTAVNRNDQSTITYDDVYDINHLWDSEHDALRLLIWDEYSPPKREYINMQENDVHIVWEGV